MLFFLHFRIILIFMIKRRYLIFLLIVLSFVSLFLGVSTINLQGLLNFEGNQWQIFFISRVPRLISILIAGASLSICGLVMQQLSRNRFVSPTTAGTVHCARCGRGNNSAETDLFPLPQRAQWTVQD